MFNTDEIHGVILLGDTGIYEITIAKYDNFSTWQARAKGLRDVFPTYWTPVSWTIKRE